MVTTLKSFSSETQYKLSICESSGTAVLCDCPDMRHRGHRLDHIAGCKHMREFNAEIQRAATFILLKRTIEEAEQARKREMLHTLFNVNNID